MIETVQIIDIIVNDRIRKDLGELDKLCNSIKEYGLIQPIVLTVTDRPDEIELVAGGRRLAALKRLGIKELVHARDFIWRWEENQPNLQLRFKAIELEENLQRKELSWQEELAAKAQLLKMMQSIYGQPKVGPISQIDSQPGFGVNRLASMLGESPTTTSHDLKIARALDVMPALRGLKNKSEVLSKINIISAVASMQQSRTSVAVGGPERSWTLIEDDFTTASPLHLADASVDLVWTDLPYGASIEGASQQAAATVASFDDSRESAVRLLDAFARESFRVLKDERFLVACFGFTYYTELIESLRRSGFDVNVVPFIWAKNSKSGENPNTRYSNSYEPLIVARKGSARFIRAGRPNLVSILIVTSKLQAVEKPVELIQQFLFDTTTEGALVVDFCAGTGTTGVACHNTKRRSILFERNSSMSTIARARLESLK